MVVFIIALRSAQVSSSWERVCKLLERCLKSICNQTSSEFRVIVACHERPDLEFSHPHISYAEVNFPVPTWTVSTDFTTRMQDRIRKIFTGLIHARQIQPSHIMIVDDDDCVSKHIAEFVGRNPQHNGWYLGKGYEYRSGTKSIYKWRSRFEEKCGTSHILKYDLVAPDEKTKVEDIDSDFLFHQEINEMLQKQGTPLDCLPFYGAVYIADSGENVLNQKDKILESFNYDYKKIFLYYARRTFKSLASQPLTETIRDEFSLYDIK